MARKNGRAPNFSLDTPHPYYGQVALMYYARDDEHAEQVILELANILAIAGYKQLAVRISADSGEREVSKFVVVGEEGDGEEAPPETV